MTSVPSDHERHENEWNQWHIISRGITHLYSQFIQATTVRSEQAYFHSIIQPVPFTCEVGVRRKERFIHSIKHKNPFHFPLQYQFEIMNMNGNRETKSNTRIRNIQVPYYRNQMRNISLVALLIVWPSISIHVTAFSSHSMVNSNRNTFGKNVQSRQIHFMPQSQSNMKPILGHIHVGTFRNKGVHSSTRRNISTTSSEESPNSRTSTTSSRRMKLNALLDKIIHKAQNIPPPVQLVTLISLYIIHLTVLTQHSIIFPFQLIPNNQGRFQSIGLDSLAGIVSFTTIALLRKKQIRDVKTFEQNQEDESESRTESESNNVEKPKPVVTIPSLFAGMDNYKNGPWKFPKPSPDTTSPKITSMVALGLLFAAYFFTGRLAAMVELYMYALAGLGVPMSIAMHRSLVVLGGHMAWVLIGSGILGLCLRPRPLFGGGGRIYEVEEEDVDAGEDSEKNTASAPTGAVSPVKTIKQKYKWYTNKWNANWMWWTIGGYFISSWFFNIADFLNQVLLPAHVFELAGEGVVSQLINPENNDIAASIVGYIAPCISAPWWEEVLYRGFLLPALCLQMKFWPAVFVSGIVFSVHHVSTTGAIPLAILGWTWAALYAKSGNLLVTILIHAMWNSRVFLGSWLGL